MGMLPVDWTLGAVELSAGPAAAALARPCSDDSRHALALAASSCQGASSVRKSGNGPSFKARIGTGRWPLVDLGDNWRRETGQVGNNLW
eukprot:4111613-Alexandrium_andersonii.AAC.1